MANHGAAGLVLIASLIVAVALSSADARFTDTVARSDANGGYVLGEKVQALACNKVVGVEQGQTCTTIAQGSGLTLDNFLGFNPNINCEKIFVGQWVCLLAQGA